MNKNPEQHVSFRETLDFSTTPDQAQDTDEDDLPDVSETSETKIPVRTSKERLQNFSIFCYFFRIDRLQRTVFWVIIFEKISHRNVRRKLSSFSVI